MTELRRNKELVPPDASRSATASLAILGAPAIVRAQGLTKVQDHAARREPELHVDLRRPRQGILQGSRHRPRARGHARRRPGCPGADGEGGRIRRHPAAPSLHAVSAEPEASRHLRHPRPLRQQHRDLTRRPQPSADVSENSPFEQKLAALKGLTFGVSTPGSLTYNMGLYYILRAGLKPQVDAKVVGTGDGNGGARRDEQQDHQRLDVPVTDRRRGRASRLRRLADQQHAWSGSGPEGVPARRDLCASRLSSARTPISANAWSAPSSKARPGSGRIRSTRSPRRCGRSSPRSTRRSSLSAVATCERPSPDGRMTAAASEAYQKVLLTTGHLKSPVAFDAVFTNKYLPG